MIKERADNYLNSTETTQKPEGSFFSTESIKETKRTLSPREVILSFLRERNWKQTNLASKVGISPQGLNNYLRGHWDFPTSMKIKIAQAFEVDSSCIWDLEDKK